MAEPNTPNPTGTPPESTAGNHEQTPPAPTSANQNGAISMTAEEFDKRVKNAVDKKLTELGVVSNKPGDGESGKNSGANVEKLEHYVAALKSGIPHDKAERYARIAETYMDTDTDFAKALEKAVADFPYIKPPASAGTAGQDGSTSQDAIPDEGKIKEIFLKG